MNNFDWFRWGSGRIPQFGRVGKAELGLCHALLEWLWVHPEDRTSTSDILDGLFLDPTSEEILLVDRIRPFIERYLNSEREQAESFRDIKRNAGRAGGLAKASSAREKLAVLSSATSTLAPTYLPTNLPTEQTEKNTPPTPRKRRGSGEGGDLFPVLARGGEELLWYQASVKYYPTKDEGHNAKAGAWEKRAIQRDSPQAQKNWTGIIKSGAATPQELCACVELAARTWAKVRQEYQFIPNFGTFLGPEKALWMNWLEEAREILAEEAHVG